MIAQKFRIRYRGMPVPGSPGFPRREWNEIRRAGKRVVGIFWHKKYRPEHFKNSAFSRYGYTPRAGMRKSGKAFRRSYTGRKLARHGHTRPLEFSGTSRRLSRQRKVSATRNKVKVSMPINAFNYRPRNSQVDMVAEMRTITVDEARTMTRLYGRYIEQRLKRRRTSKVKTIQ